MNYQLCRTNVKLGGQMKLDLILGKRGNDLVIKDFNLSPISNLIPYNHNNENILGNTHQTNINEFYKKIAGDFYKDKINPILESKYPVGSNDPIYDDTFIMGCKRMGFDRYNTQFEFFCPLWIDNYDNGSPLVFRLDLYLKDGATLIDSKKIILDKCGDKFHDKFIDYINSYFESIDFQSPMNINLEKRNAYVWGLNIDSMKIERRDIDLVDDMLSRERPLMETDYMIISSFEKHNIIAPQLFNFNLCFNIDDFLNAFNKKELIGENIKVKMRVFQGDNELELRDFYSNYSYIPKTLIDYDGILSMEQIEKNEDPNVLDYLYDNLYGGIVYTNKIVQNIIHWSLDQNNDYIFNVYDGFGGYMVENGEYLERSGKYGNSPVLEVKKYSKSLNNSAWAKLYKIDLSNSGWIRSFIKNIKSKKSAYSTFSKNTPWVNNIKYKYLNNWNDIINVILLHNDSDRSIDDWNDVFETEIIDCDDFKIAYEQSENDEKFLIIYSDNIENLTYENVIDKIKDKDHPVIRGFHVVLSKPDLGSQNYILLNSSLNMVLDQSPSQKTNEIFYVKDNYKSTLLSRYSGSINPTFIKMDDEKWYNEFYYKLTLDKMNSNYFKSGFEPNYPSIGYYSLNKTKQKYNEFDKDNLDYINEYKWFNDNLIFILDPTINVELKSKHNNGVYVKVNDLVNEYITEYYKKVGSNNDIINHILSLYEYESSYEYGYEDDGKTIKVDSENVVEYIYKVKIKLK